LKKILVTGASGFIGKSLCKTLMDLNRSVVGVVRKKPYFSEKINDIYKQLGDIDVNEKWKKELKNQDCVVHCAGRAHISNKTSESKKELEKYRLINVEATKILAKQCAEAGVKRFIFLSSIGVHGKFTDKHKPFSISDNINPKENYAISKLEAEQALIEISAKTGLEVVILRIPSVYGKGSKGNFSRLLKLIKLGLPLPFDRIKNKKSFIGIDNLIDVIIKCSDSYEAAGKTLLVSDEQDLSTTDLLRHMASSMGQKIYLFYVPIFLLNFFSQIFGRKKEIDQLVRSLVIDISYTKAILNWKPPISIEEGIKRMVKD